MQEIESTEPGLATTKEELIKLGAAVIIQARDLSIQNGVFHSERERELNPSAQIVETGESIAFRETKRTPDGSA